MRTIENCLFDYNNEWSGGFTTTYDPDTKEIVYGSDDSDYTSYLTA